MMQRVLPLILFGLLTPFQTPQQSRPDSVSPYVIEWLVDASGEIDLSRILPSLKTEAPFDLPYKCDGDCSAETFEIKVDGEEQAKTVALRIAFEGKDFYQYLIFKRPDAGAAETGWKLVGKIASADQQGGPPQHRVESGDDRTWLVIRELRGRGPNASAYGETWYEIKEGEIREVLSYPVQGRYKPCQRQTGSSLKSLLLRHGPENGVYTVPVQFLVSYEISECAKGADSPALFAKGRKAFYVWDKERGRFILDKSRSEITEDELRGVYHAQALSDEKFIEYNFSELSEIAARGNAEQKNWLRRFLTGAKDGPLKAALRQKIGRD